MTKHRCVGLAALAASGLGLLGSAAAGADIEFNRDVRPILSEHCLTCHGPDARNRKAGLRLDDETSIHSELASGSRAVVPGQPDDSELVARVEADEPELIMPPPGKNARPLSPAQIRTLRAWVTAGAAWAPHWSLAPLKRPPVPAWTDRAFFRNPIDAFILSKLTEQGLTPAVEADRVTLLRRLSFDLAGLPPTPDEVERFVADTAPDAYERAVDRLLASPHFGERMAMFWLDLVRYADSVGYHGDQPVSVWPFRDYVIRAFNANMPFDRFTVEQLAGDLLPEPTVAQRVAAGYNRLGMMSAEGGVQPREYLAKYAAERVRNLGGAWLGVTLGCCECHDHKYDPFTTRDFYHLEAFFADIQEKGLYDGSNFGPFLSLPTPTQAAALARLDERIAAAKSDLGRAEASVRAAWADWESRVAPTGAWATLAPPVREAVTVALHTRPERDRIVALEAERTTLNSQVATMVETRRVEPRPIRVLRRGNWMDDSGEFVTPAVPAVLPQPPSHDGRLNRLDLARWLVARENPLVARSLVNRLWKMDFGVGLSKKLDDLGSQGDWPSHPELLDFLASGLIDSGWDLKATVRLIVTSGTYRRTSVPTPAQREKDPLNRWLSHQGRFRLDAELVRDTALAVSGLLVDELGGPSVKPYQPPGYWSFLNFPRREWQNDAGSKLYRRGLYTHWQRQYLYPSLLAFDAPSREECTAERGRSNTPLQSLVLLNDPVHVEAARAFAEHILQQGGPTAPDRLDWAFRRALSRPARSEERAVLETLAAKHLDEYRHDPDAATALLAIGDHKPPADLDPAELAAWTSVARTILNLHATITRN